MSELLSNDMRKYNFEIFKNEVNKNNPNKVDKAIRLKAKNEKPIKISEVEKFFNFFIHNHKIDRYKISICGKSSNGYTTLKAYSDDEIKQYDEDYFVNKPNKKVVEDALNNFYHIDFYFK